MLTNGFDRHEFYHRYAMRVGSAASVLAGLLLLERIEKQRQTVILVQLGVHGWFRPTVLPAVENNRHNMRDSSPNSIEIQKLIRVIK